MILILGICLVVCVTMNIILLKKLSESAQRRDAALKEISAAKDPADTFEKLLLGELLERLKVRNYTDLAVGDQQHFSSIIMDINMADLSAMIRSKKVNEVFASINRMLSEVIPLVYDHQGMVEGFQGGGLSALFLERYEQALDAAVLVCENINMLAGRDQEYASITAGLYYGPVMIGVVGHERRMTILTLSEAKELAGILRTVGHKYAAKIVVTANFLENIEDSARKFNYRLLGYLYLSSTDMVEKVYDVFDGDVVEVRNQKRKSKMVFEKGIELFVVQNFLEARQHFIEVMKMTPSDQAARYYLLRCDEYLNSSCDRNIFIEIR